MTQGPNPREWKICIETGSNRAVVAQPGEITYWDGIHVIEYSGYEKLVKAHDEMVSINREFQKLFKQTIIESRKDYEGMRSFQRKFIEADQRLIDVERRAEGLVEILKIIASHDYAGIAMADAHITLAREALEKGSK